MKKAYLTFLSLLLLAGCSSDDITEVVDEAANSAITPQIGWVSVVPSGSTTRVERDGVNTWFDEGDYVGCIIYQYESTGYEFYANSRWKVGTYSNEQRLTIDKLWIANSTTLTETAAVKYTDGEEYSSTAPIITYDSNGYTGTTSSTAVRFYFYYPFIDLTEAKTDSIPSITQDNSTTYLMGMATSSAAATASDNATYTPATGNTINTSIPKYYWKTYPVFINTDQSTVGAQNYSDFLWTKEETGITNTSAGTLALTFEKQTATIELTSNAQLSDVKIVPVYSGAYSNATGALVRGHYFNLATGRDTTLTDVTLDNATITTNDTYLTPYAYTSSNNYIYRFLIPEQEAGISALQWSYSTTATDEDNNETTTTTTRELTLSQFADTLKAGTLYSASVTISTTTSDNDDDDDSTGGGSSDDDETSTASDMIYFTSSGVTSSGSNISEVSCTGTPSSSNTYGTCTVDGTSYSYWLKMDSSNSITFTLSTNMTAKVYLGTGGLDTKSASLKFTNSENTTTSYSYSSDEYTKDTTNSCYLTVSLTAGKWTIAKDNKESGIFLITFTSSESN